MIDLVAAATKKGHIEPRGKKLPITGDAGPLNTAILIGIYCIGHPTACWANDPESVESLWCIKKKFRCKNNHKDGKFSILEWAQLPWDPGDQRFSFLNNALSVSVRIYIFFSTIWKLVIISHRAFGAKTFCRMKLMKCGNFYTFAFVLGGISD